MKNIVKFASAALVSMSLMTSCIEETPPTGLANNDQIQNSASAMTAMLQGLSMQMSSPGSFLNNGLHTDYGYPSIGMVRDLMCSDIATIASNYEHYAAWMQNVSMGDNYMIQQWIWDFWTGMIYQSNSVIGTITEPTEASAPYLGIAYAYRAMSRMEAGQMYEFKDNPYTGEAGKSVLGLTIPNLVPGMTEVEGRVNPRLTKEELIEDIREDIALAKQYLENYNRTAMDMPNLAVVYGLEARLNLWAEDYAAAKTAAETAIQLSGCTPLTQAQWTDTTTGFNSSKSQNSWMWALLLNAESNAVKTGIINFTSWMATETTYGYACAGPIRMCDYKLYNRISDSDFRKLSWKAPAGSALEVPLIPDNAEYTSADMPDLANVKFRPGAGNPLDSQVASATDYPLMRVEEMYLIVAECDARNGDASSLVSFVQGFRDPNYNCFKTGDALLDEVLFHKRVELWGEGRVYFDWKRLELPIERYYENTNHRSDTQYNVKDGLAPWFNIVVVSYEAENNEKFVNNPDPSDTVILRDADGIKDPEL